MIFKSKYFIHYNVGNKHTYASCKTSQNLKYFTVYGKLFFNRFNNSNRTITYLQYYKPYALSIRTIMRVVNVAAKQSAAKTFSHSVLRHCNNKNYATHSVHTPDPITNSQESFTENSIHLLRRKKKSILIQHSEWVEQCCDKPHCENFSCKELCSLPLGNPKAVGHFSHSMEKTSFKLSDTDLDNEDRPQYAKIHKNVYDVASKSRDPEGDKQKTRKLNADIEELDDKGQIL